MSTTTQTEEGYGDMEVMYAVLCIEQDFIPHRLPDRSHSQFMRDHKQTEWQELMELLFNAHSSSDDYRVKKVQERLARLREPAKKPVRKAPAKKAAAHPPTNSTDNKSEE